MDNSTITQERAMRIWWVRSCKLYWCSKEQHSWQTSCIALLQVYVVNIWRFLSSCLLWLVFRSWWGHQVREKAEHPSSYNCYLPTLAQGLNKVLSGHLRQVDFYFGQVIIYHWFLMAPGKPSTKSEVRLVQCQQNLRAACPEAQAGIQFFCESFPFPLLIGSSMFLFF